MDKTWEVRPDGTYRRLTVAEDLLSESRSTMEDIAHISTALREVMTTVRDVQRESGQLVNQSRRERRLRTSTLRLVKDCT
jgi:hypothetical protein